ncbi:hypothetical protein ASG82_12175 [Mycobacterium sp. Soil538]|nr:hypothetical protein ASG82_12175 [Mycobacterium sp. Soil538]
MADADSSMMARIARSACCSSPILIARATSSCKAIAVMFGVAGIMPWSVRPVSTSATTSFNARNISFPLASSRV